LGSRIESLIIYNNKRWLKHNPGPKSPIGKYDEPDPNAKILHQMGQFQLIKHTKGYNITRLRVNQRGK
jgi:hypothetical protein